MPHDPSPPPPVMSDVPPRSRRPAHALLINELGGGLGHARRLLEIAHLLRARGIRCSLFLQGRGAGWVAEQKHLGLTVGEVILPASPEARPTDWPCHFGEILARLGFGQISHLERAFESVDKLIAAARPDLVVVDYAPFTTLACAGRVPVLWTGGCFSVVPSWGDVFPPFWPNVPPGRRVDDSRVLPAVARLFRLRGLPVPASLPRAFAHAEQMGTCFAVFDPYHRYRTVKLVGTAHRADSPVGGWRQRRVLAYLPPSHPALATVLQGLLAAGQPTDLHCLGIDAKMAQTLTGSPVRLLKSDLMLPRDLEHYSAVLGPGGSFLEEAAVAGLPQVAVTFHVEAHLRAALAAQLGVARHLPAADLSPAAVAEAVRWSLDDSAARAAAESLATRLREQYPASGCARVAERCHAILKKTS